jgi:hypothetical protein
LARNDGKTVDHDEVFLSRRAHCSLVMGAENSFIIFVDRIFTTLFERAFTNDFDVITPSAAIACVCREGNAD